MSDARLTTPARFSRTVKPLHARQRGEARPTVSVRPDPPRSLLGRSGVTFALLPTSTILARRPIPGTPGFRGSDHIAPWLANANSHRRIIVPPWSSPAPFPELSPTPPAAPPAQPPPQSPHSRPFKIQKHPWLCTTFASPARFWPAFGLNSTCSSHSRPAAADRPFSPANHRNFGSGLPPLTPPHPPRLFPANAPTHRPEPPSPQPPHRPPDLHTHSPNSGPTLASALNLILLQAPTPPPPPPPDPQPTSPAPVTTARPDSLSARDPRKRLFSRPGVL